MVLFGLIAASCSLVKVSPAEQRKDANCADHVCTWCDAYNPAAQYLSTVPTFMQADVDLLVGDLVHSSE